MITCWLTKRTCRLHAVSRRVFWTSAEEEASWDVGPKKPEERRKKISEFQERFRNLDANVQLATMSERERTIYARHKSSVLNGETSYSDPATGFKVFSGLFHYLRGYCCGCGCRHCPYQHERAPEEVKEKMRFNSAFYMPHDNQ